MISVCIATYNGEKYIKDQIVSILNQTLPVDEIIVSDDNSKDRTLDIIKQINSDKIRVLKNDIKNSGVTNNFENAIQNAIGEIIFLSDQDDVWFENKVEICVKELENNDIVISDCVVTDEELNIIHDSYFNYFKSKKGFLKNLYRSSYLGCCTAFKRKVLKDVLPFPKTLMMYHDWWFGIFAELKYKVRFIPIQTMYYRRHNDTNSTFIGESQNSLYFKLTSRFQLLLFAFLRIINK